MMTSNRNKVLAGINTLAFLATITVNALANILPINGLNTGEVSNLYPSLFTPSGITFSIWSVIYLLLGAFVIFQWKIIDRKYFREFSGWFMLSCILNISWILVWHHLLTFISVMIMLAFLFVLIKIFLLLKNDPPGSRKEFFFLHLPFIIYIAWICVATIANISAYLVSISWHGGFISEITWTIIMMSVASVLAFIMVIKYQAYAFAIVVVWALIGIAIKKAAGVTPAAVVLIVLIIGLSIYNLLQKRKLIN
jgi:benzodiazapine receptor